MNIADFNTFEVNTANLDTLCRIAKLRIDAFTADLVSDYFVIHTDDHQRAIDYHADAWQSLLVADDLHDKLFGLPEFYTRKPDLTTEVMPDGRVITADERETEMTVWGRILSKAEIDELPF